jgi:hypothetical protein
MTTKNLNAARFPAVGRTFLAIFLAIIVLLMPGCNSETLFRANFDTAIGSPPAHAQAIGTANISGPAGSILINTVSGVTPAKWLQVRRANNQVDICAFQGNFSQFRGDGSYLFSTALYIPSGAGVASIQFETFGQPVSNFASFLHIDFLENNRVRIDDDEGTTFGTFPRDQVFVVFVRLEINASVPTAHIMLSGAGASGQADRDILPPWRPMARQFGAVRIWMGFPWTGQFYATDTLVTRSL